MPLIPSNLADSLEQRWFAREGGSLPGSPLESGERLAGCIAPWFAQALANGIPCSTALARQAQLASLAGIALAAGSAPASGGLLATAIALYVTGQLFGVGVAQPPTMTALLSTELAALLGDLNSPASAKAQRFASACTLLGQATLVSFPVPPFVAPIT